jgi:E3 ubiquitin-protein ligase MARCH6
MQEFDDQGEPKGFVSQDAFVSNVIYLDTCRICSAPAEPDQPLFHPCKCSGTIRYIHQDW